MSKASAHDVYLTRLRNQHVVETQAIGTIQDQESGTNTYPELHARMQADEVPNLERSAEAAPHHTAREPRGWCGALAFEAALDPCRGEAMLPEAQCPLGKIEDLAILRQATSNRTGYMPSKLVLVVEDDPIVRNDAVMLLEDAGLNVVQMDNADDALAFIYEQPQDVAAVFSDINMPGHLSGLHLAETVARHWPGIPVVLSSGRVQPSGDLPSSVRFLPKPWIPLDVLTAMQAAAA